MKLEVKFYFVTVLCLFCVGAYCDYRIGAGISDVTGPPADIVFMGYAKTEQKGSGIHLRQFARAFIIEDGIDRIVFVSVDTAMLGNGIRQQVLSELEKRYGNRYNEQNVILSATHTHSAPGGYMMHLLFDITSFGYVHESFVAVTSGITKAIVKAHESIVNGKIFLNSGELLDVSINRSPAAYLLNPSKERERYKYNVDKEMTQLKFVATSGNRLLGTIQWFPVHATSMNNTNTLISSDNVGYASILLEQHINKGALPGQGAFVSAFASSNLGDVSPNTRGPLCLNTGLPCEDVTSTCNGRAQYCIASGPGRNMVESTKIIGERLFRKGLEILNNGKEREITGPLKIGHRFVHMPSQVAQFVMENGTRIKVHGCLSAMGYSFAAGTTDGPGEFDFKQATRTDNPMWNVMRDFIAKPTPADIACHAPKPILLATGQIKKPYEWQPQIVSIQVALLGNFIIAAVPGEFTTMSGRRLKNSIRMAAIQNGWSDSTSVVIAGLSNVYSDYVTTPEEYQLQRYEAASTIYGPYTLPIYQELYANLTEILIKGLPIDMGPKPPDLSNELISFVTPILYDWSGVKLDFGNCIEQPPKVARIGDTVKARFMAGHPRNNLMHDKTFLAIEQQIGRDDWTVVATDASWETIFKWKRITILTATSEATIEWTIPDNTAPGNYRIHHYGYYKYIWGGIFKYEGLSDVFRVILKR